MAPGHLKSSTGTPEPARVRERAALVSGARSAGYGKVVVLVFHRGAPGGLRLVGAWKGVALTTGVTAISDNCLGSSNEDDEEIDRGWGKEPREGKKKLANSREIPGQA